MRSDIRTRFAPSPTGLLHVGGLRTALFNYLFAKHHGGTFILRLEDTDRERFDPTAIANIEAGLQWAGVIPDEGWWMGEHKGDLGPYVQSERLPNYRQLAEQLVADGKAYYSRIEPADFAQRKQAAIAAHQTFVYKQAFEPDQTDTPADIAAYPIRLKVSTGQTSWRDEIRGEFTTNHDLIDDFVILKADGFPTYNFANVIDDHAMQISHVIRGDEFIASTAKHALLYDIFGWPRPLFVHLPVILGPDGKKKLSKRDGDVDTLSYQRDGYLPEALVNFLSLLGWNDGTEQEIFTLAELIKRFDVTRVQKSPAVFDRSRLDWMNGDYIRRLSTKELTEKLADFVPSEWKSDRAYFEQVVALDQERIKTLRDAPKLLDFFFEEPQPAKELISKNESPDMVKKWLNEAKKVISSGEFYHDALEKGLRQLAEQLQITTGQLFYALRISLTGKTASPGLFDTMLVLGCKRVLARIVVATKILEE